MTQAPTPTADTVRRLVSSLLKGGAGGAAGPEVRPVAGGGAYSTWWVGTRHVLRLAPDRETALRQRRELRLRDVVRPHLPVAVPVSVAHGEWAPGLTYTLDTAVPGGSGEEYDVSAVGEADLAGLLTGLREVPARQAETLGVPRTAPRSLEALRRAAEKSAVRLAAADEFDPGRLHQLSASAAVQLAAQPGTAVLVHHDLKGEHLVVSAEGRVRGILDWTGAAVGDPAEDIAGLAIAVGSPAAVRAATLAGYGARPCLRGLWLARCDTVIRLAERLRGGDSPLPLLRTQLRRAWEAILLERVTEFRDEDGDGEGGEDGDADGEL
ncbi:aminoglycoside phosphotransferase family protein [Streptomyces sp. NBC_00201]|uniref:aminoglycoside phosphotransferase family protein n=1 Tax=unclassified Streptomyces TaxID=2593676 RepID=UPI002254EB66|nr:MULTISPECIES: aminoglycoside phosphotransferase family protein [unclassified Streptomyces]MCX4884388.1 aminoglycoside phosphotransferase family protein [Streptomyces sp. NBC_00847]MCX5051843.1 aminoglycoside phosphotransferase family protein [Streptomyces sp. NBC_00474]MCX5249737.1 aminoglycoside phosphotransferase family protein [Streptomyces sp. NBC_00201]